MDTQTAPHLARRSRLFTQSARLTRHIRRKKERLPAPQNIARDDAITAIHFPIRLLTLVCFLTIVAFAWFGWILFDVSRDAKIFLDKDRESRNSEASSSIWTRY